MAKVPISDCDIAVLDAGTAKAYSWMTAADPSETAIRTVKALTSTYPLARLLLFAYTDSGPETEEVDARSRQIADAWLEDFEAELQQFTTKPEYANVVLYVTCFGAMDTPLRIYACRGNVIRCPGRTVFASVSPHRLLADPGERGAVVLTPEEAQRISELDFVF